MKMKVSARLICVTLVFIPLFLACAGYLFLVEPIVGAATFGFTLLIIISLFCYITCSFNGRRKFMRWLNAMYVHCCCRIDFTSKLSLAEAIGRYEEQPVLLSKVSFYLIDSKTAILIFITTNFHGK